MNYTVYNKITGYVEAHISCLPETIELNVNEHQGYVEGTLDPKTQMVVGGVVQNIPEHIAAEKEVLDASSKVRGMRNAMLAASDWTQVADAPVDRTAWAVYRQALRDVTAQQGFPHSIDWPTEP